MSTDDFSPDVLESSIPGVRFWRTFEADVLGNRARPIKEAVESAVDGKASYAPMPMGKVCLVVVSDAFVGQDRLVREETVRAAIARLGAAAAGSVASVLPLTSEEHDDLTCWRPALERIVEALAGPQVGFTTFPGLESRSIIVVLPSNESLATLVFSREYLEELPREKAAIVAQLVEIGVVEYVRSAASGDQRRFVDRHGVHDEANGST